MADGEIVINTRIDDSGLDKSLDRINSRVSDTGKQAQKAGNTADKAAKKTKKSLDDAKNSSDKLNDSAKKTGKGIEHAAKGAKSALDSTGSSASKFSKTMQGAASSGGAWGAAITAAVLTLKKSISIIKETAAAYEVQEKAENALALAAKNNPYLNSENVQRLKDYAAELQKISNYGDEGTIDIMAQLAATGRTESEIMKIMGAAADYAAAKHIDLKTAAETLNATYSGASGLMGRQIEDIKNLTDEQLKNGEAIDLIAKKYKGFAQESINAAQQAKNAWGDFAESVGRITQPTKEVFTKLSKTIAETFTKAVDKIYSGLMYLNENFVFGGGYRWANEQIKDITKFTGELRDKGFDDIEIMDATRQSLANFEQEDLEALERHLEKQKKLNDEEKALLGVIKTQLAAKKSLAEYTKMQSEYAEKWKNATKEEVELYLKQNSQKSLLGNDEGLAEYDAVIQRQRQIAQEEKETAEASQKTRDELRAQYDETIRQKQEEISIRKKNGKEISKEAEAQELYDTALSAYIKMMSNPAFKGNSGNYIHEANARAQIAAWGAVAGASAAEQELTGFRQNLTDVENEINEVVQNHYDRLLEQLDAEYKAVINNKYLEEEKKLEIEKEYSKTREDILKAKSKAEFDETDKRLAGLTQRETTYYDEYKAKVKEVSDIKNGIEKQREEKTAALEKDAADNARDNAEEIAEVNAKCNEQIAKADEALEKSKIDLWNNILNDVVKYTQQIADAMQQGLDTMLSAVENENKEELAANEIKYLKGEITEEEYREKEAELKKKAAQEEYKLQMWQWGVNLAMAIANVALGVSTALSSSIPPLNFINAGLTAAAGAIQIATLTASKPRAPNFSTGGIVGGTSYSGDNVAANLNSRELVMNMGQQKALWDFINGGSRGTGGQTNVVINNSASNIVSAKPQITKDRIELFIDARVNQSLQKGRYSNSLNAAQQGMDGDFYGI